MRALLPLLGFLLLGVLWDATNLYVAMKVLNANLHGSTQYSSTDAVEVYIDADNNGSTSYDTKDRQFIKVYEDTPIQQPV
jgi:hypothetical protein